MRPLDRTVESKVQRIADRQHGIVTRAELLAVEVSADQIKRRVRKGYLLPVHPGVYRVGHQAASLEAHYLAAVKACGEGAVLSGRAAGFLWRTVKGQPPAPEVTAPRARKPRGVRTVRASLALVKRAGLPLPVMNRVAGGRRVDCRWPGHRLTVELDSYTFHNSRHSWEQDRQREREARKREDEFRRFTYGDVTEAPGYVLSELERLLGTARGTASPPRGTLRS